MLITSYNGRDIKRIQLGLESSNDKLVEVTRAPNTYDETFPTSLPTVSKQTENDAWS